MNKLAIARKETEFSNLVQINQLRVLLENFTHLMHQQNLEIRTYSDAALAQLKTLEPQKIEIINKNFGIFHAVCEKIVADNVDLRSNVSFVKSGLKHLSLNAPAEFFETTMAEDLIEIYDLEGVQIFRNLRFFEITSYSLADLLTYSWAELYERSSLITAKMSEDIHAILNTSEAVIPMTVPKHIIKEIRHNPVQVCEVQFRHISLVYDAKGAKAGFIVSCRAKSLRDSVASKSLDFI